MQEINELIRKTINTYPELEYDLEAIKLSFMEELEWGADEEYVINHIKIAIAELIKNQTV